MNLPRIPKLNIPLINISTDPLDVLLAVLTLRLKQLSHKDAKLIQLSHDKVCRIAFQTTDGFNHHLVVNQGKFSREQAKDQKADLSIQFCDSEYAVSTLLSGDKSALMRGVQAGKIVVDGDFTLLLWLNKIMKCAKPNLPTSLQHILQQAKNKISR